MADREGTPATWPARSDPAEYSVYGHNELVVSGNPAKVWQKLVDARCWPDWYANARAVQIDRGDVLAEDPSCNAAIRSAATARV